MQGDEGLINQTAQTALIECRHLEKQFSGHSILAGVDLVVRPGEKIVMMGPSGCGKSTLLRCLNGLERVSGGELAVMGYPLHQPSFHTSAALQELRASVGMVFQQFNLFPHMTVLNNITFAPMKVQKRALDELKELAFSLLDRVGLKHKADAYPESLSGGQKQRVAIVRSLAMQPKLLLLDEPTSALDPKMSREVLDTIQALTPESMTLLMVTHDVHFARKMGKRLLFLDQGRLVADGNPVDVLSRESELSLIRDYVSVFDG